LRISACIYVYGSNTDEESRDQPRLAKEIFIAGNFGVGLRLDDALQLAVVPPIAPEKVVIGGNMVIAGLRVSALNWGRFREVWALAEKAKHVELAEEPDFNDVWMRNLSISLKK
jgi:uncharacterized 2Fe-2S/4Fe-4S cluster protein (DUF4445 family)